MADDEYASPEDFLRRMDSGALDNDPPRELKKLSSPQLEELAELITRRESKRRSLDANDSGDTDLASAPQKPSSTAADANPVPATPEPIAE